MRTAWAQKPQHHLVKRNRRHLDPSGALCPERPWFRWVGGPARAPIRTEALVRAFGWPSGLPGPWFFQYNDEYLVI